MDGRSRTERYKDLRDEVVNESQNVEGFVDDVKDAVDNAVNSSNTVSTEYDRMLKEQEEFLRSLDSRFDNMTNRVMADSYMNLEPEDVEETVAGIEKDIREFYEQPFEKSLEDTLQTSIREIEEVNDSFNDYEYDDVQEMSADYRDDIVFPERYDTEDNVFIQNYEDAEVEDVSAGFAGLEAELPQAEIEPIEISEVSLDEFYPAKLDYAAEAEAPAVDFDFEVPADEHAEVAEEQSSEEVPAYDEVLIEDIPVYVGNVEYREPETEHFAQPSAEEVSIFDEEPGYQPAPVEEFHFEAEDEDAAALTDESEVAPAEIQEAEVSESGPEMIEAAESEKFDSAADAYVVPMVDEFVAADELPVSEAADELVIAEDPEVAEEPDEDLQAEDFSVPDTDDMEHPDMLDITAKLHELNVLNEAAAVSDDVELDMPWMMASSQRTSSEEVQKTIEVPVVEKADFDAEEPSFEEVWSHIQENNADLQDSLTETADEAEQAESPDYIVEALADDADASEPVEPVVEEIYLYDEEDSGEVSDSLELLSEETADEIGFEPIFEDVSLDFNEEELTAAEAEELPAAETSAAEEDGSAVEVTLGEEVEVQSPLFDEPEIEPEIVEEAAPELPKVSSVFGPTEGIVNAGYTNPGLYKLDEENRNLELESAENDSLENVLPEMAKELTPSEWSEAAESTAESPSIDDIQIEAADVTAAEPETHDIPVIEIGEPEDMIEAEDLEPEVSIIEAAVKSLDLAKAEAEITQFSESGFEDSASIAVDLPEADVASETPQTAAESPMIFSAEDVLSDVPSADTQRVEPSISEEEKLSAELTDNDILFEDDIDRIINDVKSYNIEQGIRNDENTQVNIISELQKEDTLVAEEPAAETKKRSFLSGLFAEKDEDLEINAAEVAPLTFVDDDNIEPAEEAMDAAVKDTEEAAEDVAAINANIQNEFLLDDEEDEKIESILNPAPEYESQPAVSELSQQLKTEREARQAMFEQTQQLKLQMSENENQLNEVTNNVSRTNRILNVILTLLIIALFVILIVIVFFFAQERGLI